MLANSRPRKKNEFRVRSSESGTGSNALGSQGLKILFESSRIFLLFPAKPKNKTDPHPLLSGKFWCWMMLSLSSYVGSRQHRQLLSSPYFSSFFCRTKTDPQPPFSTSSFLVLSFSSKCNSHPRYEKLRMNCRQADLCRNKSHSSHTQQIKQATQTK